MLAAGQGLTRENVKSLFEGAEELPRTLPQALLALYAWDPPSVALTTMDFDQQMAECLAVQGLIERLAEATGGPGGPHPS